MYELYPYFTNDGTVGLFSPTDDDIYHSTYGALSESWQKFVLPGHIEDYIKTHDSIKILDICYGIGYNTKSSLNIFVKNALKNNKTITKNISHNDDIAAIHTDNNSKLNIASNFPKIKKKEPDFTKKVNVAASSSAAIYADNISPEKYIGDNQIEDNNNKKHILIDAIDTDEFLIGISPFIKINPPNIFQHENKFNSNKIKPNSNSKYSQLLRMQNNKSKDLRNEYKLTTEVQIILLEKLLEHINADHDPLNRKILGEILKNKNYSPYFSKYMLNLSKFYQNKGYKLTCDLNKSTFLHNIYYQYISQSYKNAQKLLLGSKIDINYHFKDARSVVKSATQRYNFIFLDAFTPSKCPCLWTLDFFNELYSKLENDGMILTYSNSASVRNAFLKSGFFVGKTYDKKLKKFIGTVATKDENLIEHKLSEHDMKLINSKAGLCYRDETLSLDNSSIISNRADEMARSELISSSQVMKGYKHNEK